MKRLVLTLVVLAIAPTAFAGSVSSIAWNQSTTGSAPTLATDGISVDGAVGWHVVVSANVTRTLSGGGSLLCYYLATVSTAGGGTARTQRWTRCNTTLDVTVINAGGRDSPSYDFEALVGAGRIKYVPSGITVSGGTTVDVTVEVRYGPITRLRPRLRGPAWATREAPAIIRRRCAA